MNNYEDGGGGRVPNQLERGGGRSTYQQTPATCEEKEGRGRGPNYKGAGRYQTSSREGEGAVDTYNDYANFIDMSPK